MGTIRKAVFAFVCSFMVLEGGVMAGHLDLKASVTKTEVSLGEDMVVTVTVRNTGEEEATLRELWFGRGSLEFDMHVKARKGKDADYRFTRIVGGCYNPQAPKEVTVPAGGEISATVPIPAILPGKTTITPVLWGRLKAEPLTVQVKGSGRRVALEMAWKDVGDITAELLAEKAPNTVSNIVRLARDGFYNGLGSHRIVKGFMIQAGCPKGDGTGGPGFSLPAEFNDVKHEKGILSMARSQHQDSAGSQFFLMDGTSPHLDNQYTAFGKLVKGEAALDKLAATEVKMAPSGENSQPLEKPELVKVTVTTVKEGK